MSATTRPEPPLFRDGERVVDAGAGQQLDAAGLVAVALTFHGLEQRMQQRTMVG